MSAETAVRAVHAWVDTHGELPKAIEWQRAGYTHPSQTYVRHLFGSWNGLIEAAGYTPRAANNPGRGDWPAKRVVEACRLFFERNGRTPRTRDWLLPHPDYPHTDLARNRFGSWNGMLLASGFEPRGKHPPRVWSREKVADAFLDFLGREGRWPTVRDCDSGCIASGMPHRATVYKLFGRWSAAKKFAGWNGFRRCSGCGCGMSVYASGCRQCHARRYWRERRKVLKIASAGLPRVQASARASAPGGGVPFVSTREAAQAAEEGIAA